MVGYIVFELVVFSCTDFRSPLFPLVYFITKTCLYNIDPLKPHFYIVKQGLTGVNIIFFLFLLKNIYCGYSLEPPFRAILTSTHNLCSEQKYEKYQSFLSENFQLLEVKLPINLNRRVFVIHCSFEAPKLFFC